MKEFLSQYFLVDDDSFYLTLWSFLLVCLTLLLVLFSYRSSKRGLTTSVPYIGDAVLPSVITKPSQSVTYVACKKCGSHAVKRGNSVECLRTVCKYKEYI